jgi:proline iminopeptidase
MLRKLLDFTFMVAVFSGTTVAAVTDTHQSVHEGFVQVPGGPVWYRIFGGGPKTPLLIVHGGPGSASCAYDPLATLLSQNRTVIVYDQLGSGRSGRPMDRSLWNLDRSVRELAAVRKALGLKKVHLMGHSWGGSLVTAYVLNMKPAGIESLVLAGPMLSTKRWIEDANILRVQLPQDVQDVLTHNEQAGTTKSKEYQDATEIFYNRFLYHQPKADLPASCAESPANDEIYQTMWGPTEFNATGNLLSFDVTEKLGRLKMPVTFFIGRYDEARLETIETFRAMIPGSTVHVFENSGHMAPVEEYQAYAAALATFLDKVDAGSAL